MSTVAFDTDAIKGELLTTLSQPPSEVGRRLQPEEILAKSLGVGVRQLRKSLSELVDEGVLVRRRGSGTYVRRMPSPGEATGGGAVSPDVLFVSNGGQTVMNGQPAKLRLGLWSDLACMQHPNHEILTGMAQEAEQLGHYLAVHSLVEQRNQPVSPQELTRRLERSPEDGYIVNAKWAELFEKTGADRQHSVIYYHSSTISVSHVPLVMFNTDEAIERAIRLLSEQGCRRIAMIGRIPARQREEAAYVTGCQLVGQTYRGTQFLDFFSPSAFQEVGQILLKGDPRPDGIYVADDHLMPGFVQTLRDLGIEAGRDLAVITLSNADVPLPEDYEWSRIEFEPRQFGRTLIQQLVQRINSSAQAVPTQALYATWQPGKTHVPAKAVLQ